MVLHDEDGKIESVRYSMLTSMLLNELQKQHSELTAERTTTQREIAELKASNEALQAREDRQNAQRVALEHRLASLERAMIAQSSGHVVRSAFRN